MVAKDCGGGGNPDALDRESDACELAVGEGIRGEVKTIRDKICEM